MNNIEPSKGGGDIAYNTFNDFGSPSHAGVRRIAKEKGKYFVERALYIVSILSYRKNAPLESRISSESFHEKTLFPPKLFFFQRKICV